MYEHVNTANLGNSEKSRDPQMTGSNSEIPSAANCHRISQILLGVAEQQN